MKKVFLFSPKGCPKYSFRIPIIVFMVLVLTLSNRTFAQWVNEGSAGFSTGRADYTSLAIDGSGTSYVAYSDVANSSKATVMKYNGSTWELVGSAGFSAGQAEYLSLAIAPDGLPVVAYSDISNSYKSTVMKYSAPLPVELNLFTANISENKVILNWQTATEVNNYGFEVERASTPLSSQWEKIGFIEGHGNINSPKDYSFTDEYVSSGKILYRLKQIDEDGGYKYSQEVEVKVMDIPTEYVLEQNYPNPFNPSTKIDFSIPTDNSVQIKVYNVLGMEVATLLNEHRQAGTHNIEFNASNLSSGIYFYKIISGKYSEIKKMILLR